MRADILRKKILNSKYGFVATPKELIAILGRDAASIYCELIAKMQYYQEKGMATDEIYCTYDDLFISTGIGKTAQQTAIKKLEENGLITTLLKGMPRKRYIKILNNEDIINNLIILGQQKIEQMINESKEESQILREKLAESIENFQLARIGEQVSTNQPTSQHESENLLARIGEQVSTNQPTCWHESAVNNNIYNNIYNNKEIIKEINNNNNISYNRENVNNNTKEENINNSSLVLDYYFEEYKNAYNKLHDKIDYQKIYSKIDNLSSRYNIDNQMWIELIDFHFNLSSLKTDGSIYHFLSDNIIKIYLTEVNKFKNSSLGSTKENYLEYAHIDNNIREILQYFIDKYYSYFGINYWEKENFYVSDIKKYAELIELLSSDFGLEITLDCWEKKIDTFFRLDEYDKTLNTFLQFSVMNDIIAGQMTNSEYCEVQQEYDDVELPF